LIIIYTVPPRCFELFCSFGRAFFGIEQNINWTYLGHTLHGHDSTCGLVRFRLKKTNDNISQHVPIQTPMNLEAKSYFGLEIFSNLYYGNLHYCKMVTAAENNMKFNNQKEFELSIIQRDVIQS
jgi:hypothetical protein